MKSLRCGKLCYVAFLSGRRRGVKGLKVEDLKHNRWCDWFVGSWNIDFRL
jgi:hypothetical protein